MKTRNKNSLRSVRGVAGALLLAVSCTFPALAQVPHLLKYQGKILNSTFSGTGRFKFALINGDGSVAYWSNDSSHLEDASEPTGDVEIQVVNGAYAVVLGDPSLPHMDPIPPSVFAHPNVGLRVWFSDAPNHLFQKQNPDERFASAGYAMQAAGIDGRVSMESKGAASNPGTQFCHSDNTTPDTLTLQVPAKGYVFISAFATVGITTYNRETVILELKLFNNWELVKAVAKEDLVPSNFPVDFQTTLHVSWVIEVDPGPLNLKTYVYVDAGDNGQCAKYYGHNLTAMFLPVKY